MGRARSAIEVHGLAQGVGFRPFVYGLATHFGLAGRVYNALGAVRIEVEGDARAIAQFAFALEHSSPPPARLERVTCQAQCPRGEREFVIAESAQEVAGDIAVAGDLATCQDCLYELRDAGQPRRFGHPFINCARCGPRVSVVLDVPYDRSRTTMSSFAMCRDCENEYASAIDRRYHAQPMACGNCGPRLSLLDSGWNRRECEEPLEEAARALLAGLLVALKGVGGFHLLCDATNQEAVQALRLRKRRMTKPLAVMVSSLAAAERFASLDAAAGELLVTPARPIVLVERLTGAGLAANLAPDTDSIGVMLAYAPVHHLLLDRVKRPLVVTSGNASDQPIAIDDHGARAELEGIADLFLTHDRPIRLPMEDSVFRALPGGPYPLRRARGHCPLPIALPFVMAEPTLALGGHLKSSFALGAGKRALLGPHIGDLGSHRASSVFADAVDHFERLFRIRPARLVCDLHPDYATTQYAEDRLAREVGLSLIRVQHHHAHLASCMADNALSGEVIGVCFDGSGLGQDGTQWGGEFLVGGYAGARRAAHLAPVACVGGDRAASEPWRMAVAYLQAAGLPLRHARESLRSVPESALKALLPLLDSELAAHTSSVGRLFDAAASLITGLAVTGHEGQAGLMLESLARKSHEREAYPSPLTRVHADAPWVIETAPLMRGLCEDLERGVSRELCSRRFHNSIMTLVVDTCCALRSTLDTPERSLERVVLGGGVFANDILVRELPERLRKHGFEAYLHRQVPPNDGGLSLGQLAVAAHSGSVAGAEPLAGPRGPRGR